MILICATVLMKVGIPNTSGPHHNNDRHSEKMDGRSPNLNCESVNPKPSLSKCDISLSLLAPGHVLHHYEDQREDHQAAASASGTH